MNNKQDPIQIAEDLKLHPSEILQAHKENQFIEVWFTDHVNGTKCSIKVRDKHNRIWNQI